MDYFHHFLRTIPGVLESYVGLNWRFVPILTKRSRGAFLGADIRDGGKRRRFLADRRQYRFSKAIRRKWALEKCCDTICHRLTDAFAWSDLSALATYSDKLMPPCPAQPLTSESHEGNKNGSSSGALWGRCKASRNTLCANEYNIHKINPKLSTWCLRGHAGGGQCAVAGV